MAPAPVQRSQPEQRRRNLNSIPETEDEFYYVGTSPMMQRGAADYANFCGFSKNGDALFRKVGEPGGAVDKPGLGFKLTRQRTIRRQSAKVFGEPLDDELSKPLGGASLLTPAFEKQLALEQVQEFRHQSSKFCMPSAKAPSQGSTSNEDDPIQTKTVKHYVGRMDEGLVHTLEFGKPGTQQFRMLFLDKAGTEISPWHDISLYASNGCLNFVCKTPRGSWAEYEPARREPSTPFKTKTRHGGPAHFAENAPWNIGMLPKTYADPEQKNESYGGLAYRGGPLEVVEIGSRVAWTGDVYSVKALAAFAMVDAANKLSWVVVTIDANDPRAEALKNAQDVEQCLGGALREIREWLRRCRCCKRGDRLHAFGLNERAVGQLTVARVVAETHASWQLLMDQSPPDAASQLPLVRPANAATYESYWSMYFYPDFISPVQIELCNPSEAFKNSAPEGSDGSCSSSEADPGIWSSTESSEELAMGMGITVRHMASLRGRDHQGGLQQMDASAQSRLPRPSRGLREGRHVAAAASPVLSPRAKPPPSSHTDDPGLHRHAAHTRGPWGVPGMAYPPPESYAHKVSGGRPLASPTAEVFQFPPEISFTFPSPQQNPPEQHAAFPQQAHAQKSPDWHLPRRYRHQEESDGDEEGAASAARLHLSIATCQAWDARGEPEQSGRGTADEDFRGEECWKAARDEAEEHPWNGLEANVRSPRGEILSGLPPTFDKIAIQLDQTEYLHARFNSRLAATKALLGRLRQHAEDSAR